MVKVQKRPSRPPMHSTLEGWGSSLPHLEILNLDKPVVKVFLRFLIYLINKVTMGAGCCRAQDEGSKVNGRSHKP